MHKHLLITTFAALCVTISTADAMPVGSLQNAAEQQAPHENLLQPVTWGYRHAWGPYDHYYGRYYSPYLYYHHDYPYYGDSYYRYWKPRWHRHWY
jgi:hypothetical protein